MPSLLFLLPYCAYAPHPTSVTAPALPLWPTHPAVAHQARGTGPWLPLLPYMFTTPSVTAVDHHEVYAKLGAYLEEASVADLRVGTLVGASCCAALAPSGADDARCIFVYRCAPIQWTAAVVVEDWTRATAAGATAVSRRAQARSWRRKRCPALGAGRGKGSPDITVS